MASGIESFQTQPLQATLPAYAYHEYADDPYFQAFVSAYNRISQGYLDWSNQNPLALYTDSNVSGAMLDYVGNNLYGIARPVISTTSSTRYGAINTRSIDFMAWNGFRRIQSGTAQVANDDIYKRTMTWFLWRGDGVQMSVEWIRRRVARFLYGAGGTDFDLGLLSNVSITSLFRFPRGAMNTSSIDRMGMNTFLGANYHQMRIIVPASSPISNTFKILFGSGYLPTPFQISFIVGVQ